MKEAVGDGVELMGYLDISFCLFKSLALFLPSMQKRDLNFKKSLSFKDLLVISRGKQT
ncbi:hypothetical protein ACFTQL_19520 [Peribacillus butanolivorans]|uniref:hypothetical protein n=1 Tax=Peribacillus butanolivorans TaxID=421767 RepID=UPI003642856C